MHQSALELSQISFAYGPKKALDQVSFTVPSGRCAILLGPNGAGKSTLFSLITRLYDSASGTIHIAGHNLRSTPLKALASLGVVFQQTTLDLDLTVRQNLLYHAALHGLDSRTGQRRIDEELDRLDMRHRDQELVRNLNGGHRRRVEIARALLHHPKLLLLDEPTVGLDVPSRKALVEHIHALTSSGKLSVLWATHLIDEIAPDDTLIILHQGTVRAQGDIPELLKLTGSETIHDAFDVLTTGRPQ
jgi:ABC-2 type transport system ATP-binding protein